MISLIHSPLFLAKHKKCLFISKSTKNEHKISGGPKIAFFLCSYFVFKQLYPQGTGAGLLGLTVFCSAAFEYCKPSPAPLSFSSISRGSISRLFGGKQEHSFLGGYPLQILLALAKELLGYFEFLGPLLQRGLAMVSMYALALHRAVAAV